MGLPFEISVLRSKYLIFLFFYAWSIVPNSCQIVQASQLLIVDQHSIIFYFFLTFHSKELSILMDSVQLFTAWVRT